MAAVTICSDFGGQENKVCHCYSIFAPSVASQEVILVKNLPASAGDISDKGLIHGSRRYPGEGNGNPLQYSCLENYMGREAWQVTAHGVSKELERTQQLNNNSNS